MASASARKYSTNWNIKSHTEITRNGDSYEINQMSQDRTQRLHSCLCTGYVKLYSKAHALSVTCPTIKGKEDQVSLKTQRRYFKKKHF